MKNNNFLQALIAFKQSNSFNQNNELIKYQIGVTYVELELYNQAISYFINYNINDPDSKFMADDGGGAAPENHIFIMNAADYLLGDQELISLRSREITNRPLLELNDSEKSRWKWINILLPSVLVVGFGFIRLKRENGQSKILEEIYD